MIDVLYGVDRHQWALPSGWILVLRIKPMIRLLDLHKIRDGKDRLTLWMQRRCDDVDGKYNKMQKMRKR